MWSSYVYIELIYYVYILVFQFQLHSSIARKLQIGTTLNVYASQTLLSVHYTNELTETIMRYNFG